MKKSLIALLVMLGLSLGTFAHAQDLSLSVRNLDLFVFSVEAEYDPIPHLGIMAGAGQTFLFNSGLWWWLVVGAGWFDNPDHSGMFGAGRVFIPISSSSYPRLSEELYLLTTLGYRWLGSRILQLDVELGLYWPLSRPQLSPGLMISLGFGARF